jgi:hypothetical protein
VNSDKGEPKFPATPVKGRKYEVESRKHNNIFLITNIFGTKIEISYQSTIKRFTTKVVTKEE